MTSSNLTPAKEKTEAALPLAQERALPSGRSVVVRMTDGAEELEVRSPTGEVEVRILLSESGPVVRLSGARLELESLRAVAINCERFEVNAATGLALRSAGDVQVAGQEMRVQTRDDIHLNGAIVRLNCEESAGIVPVPEPVPPASLSKPNS